jgi:hypothetical protein
MEGLVLARHQGESGFFADYLRTFDVSFVSRRKTNLARLAQGTFS